MAHRVAVALLALSACSAGELTSADTARTIWNGAPTVQFPAVAALVESPLLCGDPVRTHCTASLIAPRVVLTAAHCLDRGGLNGVVFGASDESGTLYDVIRFTRHPDYDDVSKVNDVAVALLDREVAGVEPLVLAAAPLDMTALSYVVRVVGFGATDGTGADRGVKREGFSRITAVSPTLFRTEPSPGLSCGGDSGGPVLLDRTTIIGIAAQGDFACQQYGDNVNVGAYRGFIDDFVLQSAGSPPPKPLAGDALCETACSGDQDCALGFHCEFDGEDPGLCTRAPLPVGTLVGSCAAGTDCPSGMCVRTPTVPGCLCLQPCRKPDSGGCRISGAPAASPGIWLVGLLVAALISRRLSGRRKCRR